MMIDLFYMEAFEIVTFCLFAYLLQQDYMPELFSVGHKQVA